MNKQEQLDIVRQMIADGVVTQEQAAKYFPELAESENEKILKAIYQYLYNVRHNIGQLTPYTDEFDRWIVWLEKQGEQKPTEEYNITGIGSKHAQGKLGEMIKNLKSAWSEEDCNQIKTIACHLDNIGNGAMAESLLNIMDKYKSLRPQNAWKPSDRELGAMLTAIADEKQKGSDVAKELQNIYQQLKKLKE